jgi:hypothetical protein
LRAVICSDEQGAACLVSQKDCNAELRANDSDEASHGHRANFGIGHSYCWLRGRLQRSSEDRQRSTRRAEAAPTFLGG